MLPHQSRICPAYVHGLNGVGDGICVKNIPIERQDVCMNHNSVSFGRLVLKLEI